MNEGIKAAVDLALAAGKAIKDGVQQKSIPAALHDLEGAGVDVMALIQSAKDIPAEIKSLADPAHVQDLVAYLGAEAVSLVSDDHAKAIAQVGIQIAEHLAMDAVALVAAIKGPDAPVPPAA